MPSPFTIVITQGQSNHPEKRALEEDLAAALSHHEHLRVVVTTNLYDLQPEGPGVSALRDIEGDFALISWLYPRSAHWILDRYHVHGRVGEVLLQGEIDEDEEDEPETEQEELERVIDQRELPDRSIYCLDFRVEKTPWPYVEELLRIAAECGAAPKEEDPMQWLQGAPQAEQLARFLQPTDALQRVDGDKGRRWYPVIDFSRCTNCMECIDFCLFGVYGVDKAETILVELPDNCRKGCPACSRVCPENAIVFPQHKTPAIAGASVEAGGLKIDLSRLFGAPESDEDAAAVAERERNEQLIMAGREPVKAGPKDDLDNLIDELDELDL